MLNCLVSGMGVGASRSVEAFRLRLERGCAWLSDSSCVVDDAAKEDDVAVCATIS